jgi:hypothetical protein
VCSYATPVVPELRGEGMRKILSLKSSTAPSRSTHTLVRDISRSSCRRCPPSIGFPLPSGKWGSYPPGTCSPFFPGQGEKAVAATSILLSLFPTRRRYCPRRRAPTTYSMLRNHAPLAECAEKKHETETRIIRARLHIKRPNTIGREYAHHKILPSYKLSDHLVS